MEVTRVKGTIAFGSLVIADFISGDSFTTVCMDFMRKNKAGLMQGKPTAIIKIFWTIENNLYVMSIIHI